MACIPHFVHVENMLDPAKGKEAFQKILCSWIGTRYQHMATQKGAGADCTKFLGQCLVEYGVLSQLKPREYYSKDWYIHGRIEVVLESFDYHIENYITPKYQIIRELAPKENIESYLLFGDILGFSTNPTTGLTNHTSAFIGKGLMIHCLQKIGVSIVPLDFTWLQQLTYIWRLYDRI
jgi:cell wall-associated NlpC family hydrolase